MIHSKYIQDSDSNFSNHRPVIAKFALRQQVSSGIANMHRTHGGWTCVPRAWRWDKANLGSCYESTRLALANIKPPSVCLTCNPGFQLHGHYSVINEYYTDIVTALRAAADGPVSRIQSNCFNHTELMN